MQKYYIVPNYFPTWHLEGPSGLDYIYSIKKLKPYAILNPLILNPLIYV